MDSYLSVVKAPGRDSNALVSRWRALVNGVVVLSSWAQKKLDRMSGGMRTE